MASSGTQGTPGVCLKVASKLQRAEQMKVHPPAGGFVIGKRDMEAEAVRVHGKGNLGAKPRTEAVAEILQAINERRA